MGTTEQDLDDYEHAQLDEVRREARIVRAIEDMNRVIYYMDSRDGDKRGWYFQIQNKTRNLSESDILENDGPYETSAGAERGAESAELSLAEDIADDTDSDDGCDDSGDA